jgi:parallel beta-helix repeat protein
VKNKIVVGTVLMLLVASTLAIPLKIGSFGGRSNLPKAEQVDSIALDFVFPSPVVTKGRDCDSVQMPAFPQYGAPGEPILPFKQVSALIPMGKEVQSVNVTTGDSVELDGKFNLEFGKTPIPTSTNATPDDRPNQTIYSSGNPFPGVPFSQMLEQQLRGYAILLLKLHPVQYVPRTGELYYFKSMILTIKLAETDRTSPLLRNLPQDRALLSDIVDNPGEAETYSQTVTRVESATLVDPSLSYDYVIITNNALKSAFLPLVNWKIQKGVNATIVLLEDILKNPTYNSDGLFGDGDGSPKFNDTQAHIRNFIKDAYTNWGTDYVLLGGDDQIMPARGVYDYGYGSYTDYNIPCDMYYGALDGSWDKDNDTIFGEAVNYWSGPENGTAGEEADFFAEVYIGRATVNTQQEAANFVSKTLAYEQNPQADYLKKALMIGEELDSITEGGNGNDLITEIIPQYSTTKLYHRDGTFSSSAVINEMNAGTHIVNHDGHAGYAGVMGLSISDVDSLTNTQYFFVYSLGCYSAAFDNATSGSNGAIAEHFILNPNGAFAYLGNSRYGWYAPGTTEGIGEQYDRSFFEIVNSGIRNLGKALQLSKEQVLYLDRWTYFDLNLLGDPETELVTAIDAPTSHLETRTDLLTPPLVEGLVNLQGTAKRGTTSDATFSNYTIEFGQGREPIFWMTTGVSLTNNGQNEVINGTLATWNTSQVQAGLYTLKLSVTDVNGRVGENSWIVVASGGWVKERVADSSTSAYIFDNACRSSIATDSSGNLFLANDYYDSTTGYFEVRVLRSSDGGDTWSTIYIASDSAHNIRYPSIAVDPARNDLFVAVEREWTTNDHDILLLRYVSGVWSWSSVASTLGSDDRFPSITSEYQYGLLNWQYISYEYVYNFDDRDLMFAKSTDHGTTWSTKKLYGNWPDSNVHAQTCITNAEGYVYIAYKWGADYNSPCEIRVDRSTDFGNTWTQYTDIDGLPNGCSLPSIAATHGGDRVVVAFQYAWSANDIDVWYSYSVDKGASWTKGNTLFVSGLENETMPAIATDGGGMTQDNIYGSFHAFCQSDDYIEYKKAPYNNLSWSQLQIVNERWIYGGLAVTTQFRNGSSQFYPCVAWIDDRPQTYGGGYTLYYSAPGADARFDSDPSGGTVEIDSISYTTPVRLNWIAGYNHTVFIPSPQYVHRHYCVFNRWSDGCAQLHIITADNTDQDFTAYFDVQPINVYANAHNVNDPFEDGSLEHPFDQIQEAIDWAWKGDVIQVAAGTFYEKVVVNKPLSLVGQSITDTVIDGNFTGNVVDITAYNVNVSGFTIRRSGTNHNGIYVDGTTSGNNVSGNIITGNGFGIHLDSCSNNTIDGNSIANNGQGIYLWASSNNSIFRNNVTSNYEGIDLDFSSNNVLRNNRMTWNSINFGCYNNWQLPTNVNDIDTSNTVDGKPVYYLVNKSDQVVPLDAGYVALINCTRIAVRDLSLTNNGQGVLVAYTNDSTITKNNLTNNGEGIDVDHSSNNTLSDNVIDTNVNGIMLEYSSNNSIVANSLTANTQSGIYIFLSSGNHIYHNNMNNTEQVLVYSSANVWDDGYPSGGNYWSDYTGFDVYKGLYQNEIGNDGIGDTLYAIDSNNIDNYPLMGRWARATVHLLLTEDPTLATYTAGQSVTLTVDVLNQLNPSLNSTLTLTITGPGNYYYFDFQSINVKADAVGEYGFTWNVPAVAGTYVVEAGLVPPRLTAYDAAWLEVA